MLVVINVSEQIFFFIHRIEGAALKNLLITSKLYSSSKRFFSKLFTIMIKTKVFPGIKFATKMS